MPASTLLLSSPISSKNIYPLWECGAKLTYFGRDKILFEKCSLESVNDPYFSLLSAQVVLADLLIGLHEEELTEAELHKVSNEVGFMSLSHLLPSASKFNGTNYALWRKNFVISCQE